MPRYALILLAALAFAYVVTESAGALITAGQAASGLEVGRVEGQIDN